MIRFKNVSKNYSTKDGALTAVKDVNIDVNDGEIFGIVGYSGAGKSTLVRMLDGLEAPSEGEIDVNGTDVAKLSGRQLRLQRQKIGMIFQHFNLLWSRTVIDNVALPLEIAKVPRSKRRQRAEDLIKLVGLEGREHSYPSELSGGQKQRVGIARALANEPSILISDEATSALDPDTTNEVLDLLLKINKQMNLTILLITHEMHAIAKVCDRVAVMSSGQVVETGSVFDVFRHPKADVTKKFVSEEFTPQQDDSTITLDELIKKYPDGQIIRLVFHGPQAELPIVSEVVKKYPDLTISIIAGAIRQTQEGALGSLDLQLVGADEQIADALAYLKKMHVETEVIHHD
ncbi:methionine ABC transporter ATP-binding protein [Lentilactobacillus parafarraginis]|uniref:ABC transporter, ATP-binding protein n=1 Tax=Lentilactobacillus parafarraginis DSM 18390 = JCM 14109 TaxID=1423786 RepID=A0A0R1YMQ5_9LACO|nr:methionine ABC transporter ATP-binding protein [Lentilactobacillus parafarraginis]KRM43386.1 ABC transporter, ATP-binding protein [Lentilactobacillus parafarraginis DSM 18390 = JCM 14109]